MNVPDDSRFRWSVVGYSDAGPDCVQRDIPGYRNISKVLYVCGRQSLHFIWQTASDGLFLRFDPGPGIDDAIGLGNWYGVAYPGSSASTEQSGAVLMGDLESILSGCQDRFWVLGQAPDIPWRESHPMFPFRNDRHVRDWRSGWTGIVAEGMNSTGMAYASTGNSPITLVSGCSEYFAIPDMKKDAPVIRLSAEEFHLISGLAEIPDVRRIEDLAFSSVMIREILWAGSFSDDGTSNSTDEAFSIVNTAADHVNIGGILFRCSMNGIKPAPETEVRISAGLVLRPGEVISFARSRTRAHRMVSLVEGFNLPNNLNLCWLESESGIHDIAGDGRPYSSVPVHFGVNRSSPRFRASMVRIAVDGSDPDSWTSCMASLVSQGYRDFTCYSGY